MRDSESHDSVPLWVDTLAMRVASAITSDVKLAVLNHGGDPYDEPLVRLRYTQVLLAVHSAGAGRWQPRDADDGDSTTLR